MNLIEEIRQYLAKDLEKINAVINTSLAVEEQLITVISNYLAQSGGKKIRPIITILAAKMFAAPSISSDIINLATAVEFIHMATLLHDDVIDGSKMRRFLPAANTIWGSKASILVGDFLFSRAFRLIVSTSSLKALNILSNAAGIIVEGEVSQLAKLEEKRLLNIEEYLEIITAKTGELFAAAAQIGAVISNQPEDYCLALRIFGYNLGNIFQITDDILDYLSTGQNNGKTPGSDFYEGKITLPLILLANKLSITQKEQLEDLIKAERRTSTDFLWVQNLLTELQIKMTIENYLMSFRKAASDALEQINITNQAKEYLKLLIDFAINRDY